MTKIFSIKEMYLEKADRMLRPEMPAGHKGYTRVRRGKLESIKQKGAAKAEKKLATFGAFVTEQLKNAKNAIINKFESDLKTIGVINIQVKDALSGGTTDLAGLTISGNYAGKPVSIRSSHQGNTLYFKFGNEGEEPAMSASGMKNKMDAKLKKENK